MKLTRTKQMVSVFFDHPIYDFMLTIE